MPSKKTIQSPVNAPASPNIGATQLRLLERLCNAAGVAGDEGEVRKLVMEEIAPYVSDMRVDTMGNVLAIRQGSGAQRPRVMLAAHMDEVGFMIVQDEENGIFRFETIGGIEARRLVGKPVVIGSQRVPGVIGAKPIHLSTAEERSHPLSLDELRIDVSPDNASKVKVGDWATFAMSFTRIGPSLCAKALDDRLGVATLVELVKNSPPNIDLLAAFTVQEEAGARGARIAAYALDPHIGIALDCTPAHDLPLWNAGQCDPPADCPENARYNTRLGAGPAIYVVDSSTISDPRLVRHFIETAEALGIPYQIRQPGGGGTDAGSIHKQRGGIPSISISAPGRYLHTAASICRLEDWKNMLALVYAALVRLTPETLHIERLGAEK